MLRFIVLFLLILLTLFTAELMQPVQQAVIVPFTEGIAGISVGIIQLLDARVYSHGVMILDLDSGFTVSIQAGCNGVEASIVLIAAMLAFPSAWRMKLIGIGIGFIAIQAMNMLRIISLFYLGQWSQTAFEWGHLYIWQALIMLDVLIVFLVWLRFVPRRRTLSVSAHAA